MPGTAASTLAVRCGRLDGSRYASGTGLATPAHAATWRQRMDLQQFHAMEERCSQEDMPQCTAACPLHVDVRGILAAARQGDFSRGYALFAQLAPFPGIISRMCDHPCQTACIRESSDAGIAVNALERACVAFRSRPLPSKLHTPAKDKTIAVVGAGISGLAAAFFLARKGYRIELFDAGVLCGGTLTALSEETLPRGIMTEDFAVLERLGVTTNLGVTVSNTAHGDVSFNALLERVDAVYLAPGKGSVAEWDLGLGTFDDGTLRVDRETLATTHPKVFAGGGHRPENASSFIRAISDGKSAMISIERFLQGASLTANRVNEGPRPTRLFARSAATPLPAVTMSDPGRGYSRDEAVAEAERCLDCQCLECVSRCEYIRHYKSSPRQIARQVFKNMSGVGGHRFNEQMNSCSLCRQCEAVCPDGFNLADICRAARESLVEQGKMPPSAFDFALHDLRFSGSDAFTLARHEPGHTSSAYAFYPGCQLSGAAPWQVSALYAYLRGKISAGVGLLLGCCGVQADWAGEKEVFTASLAAVRDQWERLGRPAVILACPTCHTVFKKHLPEIPIEFVFPLMERLGLPHAPDDAPRTLAVHDSCTTRHETDIQESVRRILSRLGHTVTELPDSRQHTACCGFGGLMQISNRHLAHQVMDRRIGESDDDYLTYCAMCRESFSSRGKTTFHRLDLLFGDASGHVAARPAAGYSLRHDNRARLKKTLLRDIWEECVSGTPRPYALRISPEVRGVMEDAFILDDDVRDVIAYAERTGNRLRNRTNGHFMASFRPGHVTFWVEYSRQGETFVIHDAYCHRLEIVGLPGAPHAQ